jgi:hypothetical protein
MLTLIICLSFLINQFEIAVLINQDQYELVSDDFTNKPFGVSVSPENVEFFTKRSFSIEKKGFVNPHSGKVDTILIYRNEKSEFHFYKTLNSTFLQKAYITDPSFTLAKGIKIGQSLGNFKSVFKISSSVQVNCIVVKDSEDFSKNIFLFKNGVLESIEINSGVD